MRIVVHGQEAFGKTVLERLLAQGEHVVGVFCAPDKDGRAQDPLKTLALDKGLPVHQPASWKTPEALALMQAFKPDLCMMAYVTLFVPKDVLNAPRLGTFQYHPSLLPLHRGPSSINWPIAQGKTETGLSIFWPDEGLDEGPILMQKTVEIGPDDTLGDVYFKKLFPLGVEAMMESLDLVRTNKAPRIAQDLSKGSYESWFRKEDARIDFDSRSARENYNIIRAANPQPGGWTLVKGQELQIFDAAFVEGDTGLAAGTITDISVQGLAIAGKGGTILAKRVRLAGGQKIPAQDLAATLGLTQGDRLGE